jgi:integrase
MTCNQTSIAISPLRVRMIEDMTIRGFGADTQRNYLLAIRKLAAFLGRSPNAATSEDIRRFQLHLTRSGVGMPTINNTVSALRFFFKVTLGRDDIDRCTQFVREPRKLPVVLSPQEVARLIDCAPGPGLKYKAAFSVAYGAGLRAAEVVSLQITDIDSERMVIRVEQGKGRKDRYVMLSPHLLDLLRAWWRQARPPAWLFPGRDPVDPISTRQFNRAVHAAAECGLGVRRSVGRYENCRHRLSRSQTFARRHHGQSGDRTNPLVALLTIACRQGYAWHRRRSSSALRLRPRTGWHRPRPCSGRRWRQPLPAP